MLIKLIKTLGIILAVVFLASCSATNSAVEPTAAVVVDEEPTRATGEELLSTADELIGVEWRLISLEDTDPIDDVHLSLTFDGERLSGYAGCNQYGGLYLAGDDGSIAIPELESTEMGCVSPEGIMDQEAVFLSVFPKAAWFEIIKGRLEIENADGEVILIFSGDDETKGDRFDGSEWMLLTIKGEPLLPDTRITIEFTQDEASGFAGCNSYSGNYTVESENAFDFGVIASTVEGCLEPEGVLIQEELYLLALGEATGYVLEEEQLSLQDATGQMTLAFVRRGTQVMDPAELIGTEWRLVELSDFSIIDGSSIKLSFIDSAFYQGDAGCRTYDGTYNASGGDIFFSFIQMSESACLNPTQYLEQESQYTDALTMATNYRLFEDQLEIETADGKSMLFAAETLITSYSLDGSGWRLNTFVDGETAQSLLAGSEITLDFSGGTVTGSAGCNGYSGSYTASAGVINFGDLVNTEMACLSPEGVMEQESKYLKTLREATTYDLEEDRLILQSSDDRALYFSSDE